MMWRDIVSISCPLVAGVSTKEDSVCVNRQRVVRERWNSDDIVEALVFTGGDAEHTLEYMERWVKVTNDLCSLHVRSEVFSLNV